MRSAVAAMMLIVALLACRRAKREQPQGQRVRDRLNIPNGLFLPTWPTAIGTLRSLIQTA